MWKCLCVPIVSVAFACPAFATDVQVPSGGAVEPGLTVAADTFRKQTGNEITFEYILFQNFNDTQKDAEELVKIYRRVPADLVNIIEYNPIDAFKFTKPDEDVIEGFMGYLEKHKVNARLRRSRGKDIDAACGQLANKN